MNYSFEFNFLYNIPYSRALRLNSLCHIIIKIKNQSFFIDEYFLEKYNLYSL